MPEQNPQINVLGVYQVPSDEDLGREQLREYYDKNTVNATDARVASYIDRVVPLVVFDVMISGLDDKFEVAHFTQEMEEAPQEAWQVAYDEALLSRDGSAVLDRRLGCANSSREARLAFYFHYYVECRAMKWSFGWFECAEVKAVAQVVLDLLAFVPAG